jgi:type I restriction enzyme R subunit
VTEGGFSASVVEEAALAWLKCAGWSGLHGADIAPGEPAVERENFGQAGPIGSLSDVLLPKRVSEELRVQALGPLLRETA